MANPPDDLLDHDYDGIKEFDNPLPKWWVYLFYLCIAAAFIYVPYYHFGPGALPREVWAEDMGTWWQQHPPPKLASAEELEAMAQDPSFVANGEAIYKVRCVSCHAADGGGLVGPNLTDEFTVYGYGRDQIVAVVFHGTKNGMLAWKDQLTLDEVYQVGAYVQTLRGTTPAKPKAPDGVAIVDAPAPDAPAPDAPAPDAPAEGIEPAAVADPMAPEGVNPSPGEAIEEPGPPSAAPDTAPAELPAEPG